MWIYFLFALNVLFNIYSIVFRLTRGSSLRKKEWYMILHAIMTSFFQPMKDFLTSMTLLYLVYTQCEDQVKKIKRNVQHRGQGDPLKEIYSLNSVMYSTNLKDKEYDENEEQVQEP